MDETAVGELRVLLSIVGIIGFSGIKGFVLKKKKGGRKNEQ